MDTANLILLILLGISVVGNNQSVAIAVAVLLIIRLLHLYQYVPLLEKYGLQVGIIVLTIGVLAPIASGKIGLSEMTHVFTHPSTILGVVIGILVAYLGGRGLNLLTTSPLMVAGIMIGTIIGVSLLRGVPVGPLIAAGITSLILGMFK
jgi:uncharacterized membrane protein (DUF441 family)